MASIAVCPSCSGKLRVPDDLRGQKVRCPACNFVFDTTAPPPEVKDLPLELTSDEPPGPQPMPPGTGFGFVELSRSVKDPSPAEPPPVRRRPAVPPPVPEPPPPSPPPRLADDHDDLKECPDCGKHVHRDSRRCPHCDRRLGRPRDDFASRRDWEPDRGGLVLTLGILSLVCLTLCGPVGVALGITAWVLGSGDLRKMRERRMDPAGYGITHGGWVCGILGTALNTLWTLGCLGFISWSIYEDTRPRPIRTNPPIQRKW